MEFYILFVSKYCAIKMHFPDNLLMTSSGMHCSNIKKNQYHQTKILDVLIFSQLVPIKVIFGLKQQ